MKTQTFFLFLLLIVVATSCNWLNPDDEPTTIELDEKSASVVNSNNEFGLNLFETILASDESSKNMMISPLSVSQALSMTLNGAKENTLVQMSETLAFGDMNLDDINACNQKLSTSLLTHDKKIDFQIANSIWYRNDFTPNSVFVSNNKSFYGATVKAFDPAQPEKACDEINEWVSDHTKGKIDKIIDQVKAQSVMFLVNAIYFKAQWKTQFKKSSTQEKPFTLDDNTTKDVQTMVGEVKLSYYNDEKYSVIKLPYGSGKFNMLIFLPEEGSTTNEIAPLLNGFNFDLLNGNQLVEREIWLPKFEFSYDRKLNGDLVGMGMTDAFDPAKANFLNMGNAGLYISEVRHKTYIKTDEEGTEAAAATSVTMDYTSIGPEGIIKIDHSFLFAIVEEDTNSILFVGKVYDPSLEE